MKKPTAAERALAALKKHGKLVRNKNYYGEWQTPEVKVPGGITYETICGTVTIKRLVDAGLAVFVPGGVEPTARVLRDDQAASKYPPSPSKPPSKSPSSPNTAASTARS